MKMSKILSKTSPIFLIFGIFLGYTISAFYEEETMESQVIYNYQQPFSQFVVSFPYLDYHIPPDMLDEEIECRKAYLDGFKSSLKNWQKRYASDVLPTRLFPYEPCIDLVDAAVKYHDNELKLKYDWGD